MSIRWVAVPVIAFIFTALCVTPVQAAPNVISYQGRLTDSSGVAVPDSSYSVIFAIYADSTGGPVLWEEGSSIETHNGMFSHQLGSLVPLPRWLFQDNDRLYLQLIVVGETVIPRTRLSGVPYAKTAAGLRVTDANDSLAIRTFADSHQVSIFDHEGKAALILRGEAVGNKAVVLPDSSINAEEMLDEPGIAVEANASLIPLPTGSMADLVTIKITIPTDGYIVLHGKCYVLLSGTTGANTALVQVDEHEGGGSNYPYYTVAGLGGYVNTSTNYFPVYVTRTYYKTAGTYTFRMEGRASYPIPAEAKTWDHILTAVFYPTSYEAVKQISSEPGDHPEAIPIILDNSADPQRRGTYYEMDLRYYERQAKAARKTQKTEHSQNGDQQ